MNLKPQQQKAFDALVDWMAEGDGQKFALSGYAGTGKSYLISQFLRWYLNFNPNASAIAIAPSHKAKKNLANFLADAGLESIEVSTVARFLGLQPYLQTDTGKEQFRNNGKLPDDYDLIIIDEAWMIQKENIESIIKSANGKILFVGDNAQLEPINEAESLLETMKNLRFFQLSEVIRYEGELAKIAASWRVQACARTSSGIKANVVRLNPLPIAQTSDDSIRQLSKLEWIEEFIRETSLSLERKDYAHCKILTYTNRSADKWNDWVRSELWGNSDSFNIGDRLISRKPLFRGKLHPFDNFQIIADNSVELTVISEYQVARIHMLGDDYEYLEIPCQGDDGQKITIFAITEESDAVRKLKMEACANEAKNSTKNQRSSAWKKYYQLINFFDNISFGYAITTHKAQGSTFKKSYLDLKDMNRCSNKNRLIYTALTRANQAVIYT